MYKKGDLHIGDPLYYQGKLEIMSPFGLKQKDQVYIIIDQKEYNLYTIGYQEQVKQLIDDLNRILKQL